MKINGYAKLKFNMKIKNKVRHGLNTSQPENVIFSWLGGVKHQNYDTMTEQSAFKSTKKNGFSPVYRQQNIINPK